MKKTAQTIGVMALCVCLISAVHQQLREISWVDLSPAPSASDDPLAHLTPDQLDLVLWVLNVLETEPIRDSENEALYEDVDEAMPAIRETGIDLEGVLGWRERARTAVVEELNGERVRMPGYLLPLELEGTRVTEFFLVPYVGACIHVPPPPPNQIVHVKMTDNESYQSRELFEPVWVTGVISTTSTIQELYLVDGSADINTGYSIAASRVEPYR
jgi:hypothetical protein